MKNPLVSIIIPSYNSEKFIKKCLESIKKQTYSNIEIILVDRNSNDKTLKIAKIYTNHVYSYGPERSAQVNYGIGKSSGKYIYRVDSDFVLDPDIVKQCVEKCEKENLDGIAVHNTSYEGLGFWSDVRKFERNTYIDDALIVAVRFFSRKAFDKIGGFDETLFGPEDYDFHNRFIKSGFNFGRIKAFEKHLGEPKNIRDIWNKHFFYGQHMFLYFKKYPEIAGKQFNPVRLSYLRHLGKFILNPRIFLGLIIMTIVKFLSGGLGFLFASILFHNVSRIKNQELKTRLLYSHFVWTSIFACIRFWTGSYEQIEKLVPKKGTIMDLGSGYGILSNYLAFCSSDRKIIGVDTDKNKVHHSYYGIPNTSFKFGDATKMKMKNIQAILIIDVLHHLSSYDAQDRLVKDCSKMLSQDGILIIVDVDKYPLRKLLFGRVIDFLMYKGERVYYRYKKEMIKLLKTHFSSVRIEKLHNNPFSQLVFVCQKE